MNALVALTLLGAMALPAAWLLAWPLLGAWLAVTRRGRRSGRSWARFTPVVAVLPVVGGAFLAISAFIPGDPHQGQVLACHCHLSHPGWMHLCPVHPMSATPLLMALAIPAALLLFRPALVAMRLYAGRVGPAANGGDEETGDGIRLVDLGIPLAYTAGLWRPVVTADRGYWRSLDGGSREVIEAHEAAHVRRRDPFTRAWLSMWLAFAPGVLARALAGDWREHAELCADGFAAEVVGDPLRVAEVLVRQRRVQTGTVEPAMAWTAAGLERRVTALLADPPRARPARSDLDVRLLAVAASIPAVVLVLSPWLHHNLEHLINTLF